MSTEASRNTRLIVGAGSAVTHFTEGGRVRATLAVHSNTAATCASGNRRTNKLAAFTQTQSRSIIPVTHLAQQLTGRVIRLLPAVHTLIRLDISTSAARAFHLSPHHGCGTVSRSQRACSCGQGRDAHSVDRL